MRLQSTRRAATFRKGETTPDVNLNKLTDEQREILREAESRGTPSQTVTRA